MESVGLILLPVLCWAGISLILRRARTRAEHDEAITDRLVQICRGG